MVKLFIEFLRMKNNVTPNNAFYSLIYIYYINIYVCVIPTHRIGNPNSYTHVMFIICTNIIEL